jgi:hypothetical protein
MKNFKVIFKNSLRPKIPFHRFELKNPDASYEKFEQEQISVARGYLQNEKILHRDDAGSFQL